MYGITDTFSFNQEFCSNRSVLRDSVESSVTEDSVDFAIKANEISRIISFIKMFFYIDLRKFDAHVNFHAFIDYSF